MILSKRSKCIVVLGCLCSSLALASNRQDISVSLQSSSYGVETKQSTQSIRSSATLSAIEIHTSFNYFFRQKFSIEPSFFTSISGDVQSTGYGISGKYYFQGGQIPKIESLGTKINLKPIWSSHVGLGLQRIALNIETASVAYLGYALEVGTERSLSDDYAIQAKIFLKSLTASETRSLTANTIFIGMSYRL